MLERPPGGAMIFWAVRLAMWSSACDPAEKVGSGGGKGSHTVRVPKARAAESTPTRTTGVLLPRDGHGG